jgi:hypothetical protein
MAVKFEKICCLFYALNYLVWGHLNQNFAIDSSRGDTFLKGVTSKLKGCDKF